MPRSESLVNWPMRRNLKNGCLSIHIACKLESGLPCVRQHYMVSEVFIWFTEDQGSEQMPEEHWNYVILWEKNLVLPLDVIHHANVPLPSKLNVSDGCLSHNWKKFKRQFQNFRVASRLDKEPNEFQTAVFLGTVGEDAMGRSLMDSSWSKKLICKTWGKS